MTHQVGGLVWSEVVEFCKGYEHGFKSFEGWKSIKKLAKEAHGWYLDVSALIEAREELFIRLLLTDSHCY